MNMDESRGRIFGITWPTGIVFRFDIANKDLKVLGKFFEEGEVGVGPTFRVICRSIAVCPDDGAAYFSTGDGKIHRYNPSTDSVEVVQGDDLKKDYFGVYDQSSSGNMAYNWRQIFWHAPSKEFYGVHGNSGYLFRFNPKTERVEVLTRLTSELSQRSGMFDQFSYGYLGFALGPNNRTIYYLTGGPIYKDGKRVRGVDSTAKGEAKGLENLHLVTYDIPLGKYVDHGPIFFENGDFPTYVNSIAIGAEGTVYSMGRVLRDGKTLTDLFSVKPRDPLI
jgi:hypothetical protein